MNDLTVALDIKAVIVVKKVRYEQYKTGQISLGELVNLSYMAKEDLSVKELETNAK